MEKDYDRTICNKCSIKEECEKCRNTFWCTGCVYSLKCYMRGETNYHICRVAQRHWENLPFECALIDEVLRRDVLSENNIGSFLYGAFGGYKCPRCLRTSFTVYTTTYAAKSSKKRRQGQCFICGARAYSCHLTVV